MAIVEGNSLEFALQEIAIGFSRSGKSIKSKTRTSGCLLNGKDVLAVLSTGFVSKSIC